VRVILELRCSFILEITLTPALSRDTGRGSKFTANPGIIRAKRNSRDPEGSALVSTPVATHALPFGSRLNWDVGYGRR
jgi:hypothetical protein